MQEEGVVIKVSEVDSLLFIC